MKKEGYKGRIKTNEGNRSGIMLETGLAEHGSNNSSSEEADVSGSPVQSSGFISPPNFSTSWSNQRSSVDDEKVASPYGGGLRGSMAGISPTTWPKQYPSIIAGKTMDVQNHHFPPPLSIMAPTSSSSSPQTVQPLPSNNNAESLWTLSHVSLADTRTNQPESSYLRTVIPPNSYARPSNGNLPTVGSVDDPEFVTRLALWYFKYIHNQQYPLFHKPTFLKGITDGKHSKCLLYAFCALAGRYSPDETLRAHLIPICSQFASRARDLISQNFDTISIETIQTLNLLAIFEQHVGNGGKSWTYTGIALRMAQTLGLEGEADDDTGLEVWELEVRRRVFWTLFMQDCVGSSRHGRPSVMQDQDFLVHLPMAEVDFNASRPNVHAELLRGGFGDSVWQRDVTPQVSMGALAYLVRVLALWGHISRRYILSVTKRTHLKIAKQEDMFYFLNAAKAWEQSLPDHLTYSRTNLAEHAAVDEAGTLLLMHSVKVLIVCFLNLPMILEEHNVTDMNNVARKRREEQANRLTEMMRDAEDMGVVFAAPFFGYGLFVTSLVQTDILMSSETSATAKNVARRNLMFNLHALRRLNKYTKLTDKLVSIHA